MTQEAIFEKHSLSPTIKKYKNTNAPGMMLTSFFNPTIFLEILLPNLEIFQQCVRE